MSSDHKETNAEYHADLTHVSNSMLKVFAESPQKYYQMFVAQTMPKPEQSQSVLTGSVVHCLFLEPEKFGYEYAVAPTCDRRTTKGKTLWSEFVDAADGKTVITGDTYDMARAMVDALMANKTARAIREHKDAVIEQSIRWTDDITGLKLKAKPDIYIPAGTTDFNLVIDLKTSQNPAPRKFKGECYKYDYFMQGGFYVDGCRSVHDMDADTVFCIIAIGNQPPYDVYPYKVTPEHLSEGYDTFQNHLQRLWRCQEDNDWEAPEAKEFNEL